MTEKIGKETLEVISSADQFNKWMFQIIKPFIKGEVLEIGSGIGNISQQFLQNGYSLMTSDLRTDYCEDLEKKFSGYLGFRGVTRIDLVDPHFKAKHGELLGSFDTVFALNVIEHIEDDILAIANCRKLLKAGGVLIILVPSYKQLFNSFDIELGHFRRYNISKLAKVFNVNELEILHTQYFNLVGTLGWYINGNILKRKIIPEGQMSLYNKLVPFFKVIDKILGNKIGLSTIIVGEKNL
ncbi:methyltransferase [Christiangramia gaetbulicola]|nr:methyltransferase [Christiangramia gaetbulicola]